MSDESTRETNAAELVSTGVQLRRRGFTLLELTIVMALIGVVSMLAVPNIASRIPQQRINQTVWQLNSALRTARVQAMSQSITVEVRYEADNSRFAITADNETTYVPLQADRKSVFPGAPRGVFHPNGTFTLEGTSSRFLLVHMSAPTRTSSRRIYYSIYVWPTGQVTVHRA